MQVGDLILSRDSVLGIIVAISDANPQPYKCKWFDENYGRFSYLTRAVGLEYRQNYAQLECKVLDKKYL
jgi:hypothetical protein